jgi:RNA polymerase sigma-70 factor, ECF subfamily
MSESELVRQIPAYGPRMLRIARRILRNEEDARDAVQDAFLSLVRSAGEFQAEAKLSTWIHRVTVNAALMKLRSRRRAPDEESIEPLLPRFRADGHQLESSVRWRGAEEALEEAEMRRIVHEAIGKLPESYRIVLLLRDIEELTPEETAEALGITRTAVKVRLHRGRQALRTLLDPHLREAYD